MEIDPNRVDIGGFDDGAEKEPGKTQFASDDVGLTVLSGAIISIDPNGPEARRVLRKIDLHLMPLLCVTYLIQVIIKPKLSGMCTGMWKVVCRIYVCLS
jgi:hypothetical protein